MFTQLKSLGLFGLNAFSVDVEVSMNRGKPQMEIVGLPDTSVRESRERIRSALSSLSIALPARLITVNLAPADVKKIGTMHDLAILLGILVCMERIPAQPASRCFIGEVSLSGLVRSVSGVLPMALLAAQNGVTELYVPAENASEASAAGIPVYGVHSVGELIAHLNEDTGPAIRPQEPYTPQPEEYEEMLDFADVKGQQNAKYALEIAAAGGHNALMIGSPGSGKSMLAKRIPSILPAMTTAESMETTQIYSIAGLLDGKHPLMTRRPFRSPHHTISGAGLVGGGTVPRPGEISLAHNGLLFLDELAEFDHRTLEIMRQPLEDRKVTITRAAGTVSYPCSFMLVGAMNPCPCGYYGHPKRKCTCSERQVRQYLNRISGPLLDRFDLHIEVEPVSFDSLSAKAKAESSAAIRQRVQKARELQNQRFAGTGIFCNAAIPAGMLQDFCPMDDAATALLRAVFDKLGLSARAYDRILKVARTIADLDGSAIDWENTLNHLDTSMPGRISLGVLYPGNEGMTQANNGIIHTMNFTVLAGAAENSEIRVEVKKFNYMMTDDDQYPVPTQTQSGWIFVDGGESGVPGDADGDGVVTAADALLVMRCALGTAELSPETAALCDADGDGNVTLSDAVLILRAALGLG